MFQFAYDVAEGANEILFRSRLPNVPAESKIIRVLVRYAGRFATLLFHVAPELLADEEALKIWLRGQIKEWIEANPPPNN